MSELQTQTAEQSDAVDPDISGRAPNLAYIPALDGIRGVAMIVIMGYHGGVFFTSGGFYSLDMFFTLSGFLITSLLINEWQRTSMIRLRVFWARRARRLLPGLLLMLVGVALYNAFLVPPGTYTHLRSDGIAALFYFANWHFIAIGSNYFVQTGPTSPLTHTWSLAVEEQFYLVWPLIVLGVFKLWKSRLALLLVCLIGALASALEMAILYSPADVNRLYYGTDTRAQSLLIGAALAVALSLWADRRRRVDSSSLPTDSLEKGPRHRRAARHLRPGGDQAWAARSRSGRVAQLVIGLGGVAASVVLWIVVSYNDSFAYRGGFLTASLATSAILLSVVCSQRSVLALVLSFPPLRYVGRISYGLYLWHFPLFLYLDHARTGLTGDALFAFRVAVTVAVATVSFYALERPIRQGTFLRGWKAWSASPVAVVAVVVALFAATTAPAQAAISVPASIRIPASIRPGAISTRAAGSAAAGTGASAAGTGAAAATQGTAAAGQGTAVPAARAPVKVLWVGDSSAFTLAIGMSQHQGSYGVESLDGGILGCGVTNGSEYEVHGVDAPMATACGDGASSGLWPQLWRNDIALYKPNVVVILAGRWEVANRTFEGQWTNIEDPVYASYVKQQLEDAVEVAGSGGAQVVLMTAPCYDSGEQPNGDPWPEDSPTRLAIYNALVRQVAATSAGTSLIDFNAMACPGGQYEEFMDGVQVREADGVHFTETGGDVFASRIWPIVVALGGRQLALAHDAK